MDSVEDSVKIRGIIIPISGVAIRTFLIDKYGIEKENGDWLMKYYVLYWALAYSRAYYTSTFYL